MRTLNFRAWNEEDHEMIVLENSGLQYYDFEGSYSLGFTVDGYSGFWAHEQYESATEKANNFPIMQFTGAKDKNGNEIFESDINQDRGVVVWNEDSSSFCWDYPGVELMPFEDENTWCVIVGNIYENPNLVNA